MQAVRQVVFTDVQISIRQRAAVLPVLGYWSALCSYWLTQNRRCLWLVADKKTLPQVRKACREYRCKNNRITQVIGVILAFTGKKMFYFNQKSEVPLKNSIISRGPC